MKYHHSHSPRSGFTTIELLVAITIIALLLSLLIPAVQTARESARRTQCLAHLKEMGDAIANYESQHGILPPQRVSGGFRSPLTELLPMIEQTTLYDQILKEGVSTIHFPEDPATHNLPIVVILRCPSDGAAAGTNYRFNLGPDVLDIGLAPLRIPAASSSVVTDGLSNTVAMSEALMSPAGPHPFHRADAWYTGLDPESGVAPTNADVIALCNAAVAAPNPFYRYVGHDWPVCGLGHSGYNHVLPPNPNVLNCILDSSPINSPVDHHWPYGILSASSNHAGGVNVLMLDGSARFASDNIDIAVWQAISTASGAETRTQF